jgi:hypothetical protein
MVKYIDRAAAALALAALVVLGACRSDQPKSDTTLASDSALSKDLALAGRDTTVQPQLKDVPANPPATRTPEPSTTRRRRPTPPATRANPSGTTTATTSTTTTTTTSGNTATRNPVGATPSATGGGSVGTIPSGTTLRLSSASRVCTNTNAVGDKFTATVADPVAGTNGATIPAGATVTLTVTQLKRSENANDKIIMEFAVNSVTYGGHTYALDANVQSATVDRVRNEPRSKDVQKVVGGAIIGAIAGRILGKSTKGTVIGGAAGAAAGAATAAATANYEGCVPSGGSIVVKLNSATEVRA